jgi:predicted permease
MSVVFVSLVPLFLLILTGAALRRFLTPGEQQWVGVERLVYYVLFPALLVQTLARAELGTVPALAIATSLAVAILLMAALCLAARAPLTRRLDLDGPAFTSMFQGATRWQTFVALAVANNLYGDGGVAVAAVAVVAMIPLLNVLNVWVLAHFAAPRPPAWRDVLTAIARNPLIWACLIGGALNLIAVPLPEFVFVMLDQLGRSSLPVGLLVVGAGLNLGALTRPHAATFVATALKLVVMPSLAITLGLLLGLRGTSLVVVACCASVPSASNAYVLARQMGGDAPLMAEILTLQTLVAMATMPLAIAFAERL